MLARREDTNPDTTVSSLLPVTKEKKRKSEKRREKSRDAARCRRGKESEIFQELSEQIPVCLKSVSHLDKASLVRLAIGYLKIRYLFTACKGILDKKADSSFYDSFYLPTIDGFLLVISQDGDMVYLSENVQKYLGFLQVDLMGHSIFEYSHPCDHEEVREVLQTKLENDRQGPFSIFLRMKCVLSQRGRNTNIRSATFKVIHCTGHMLRYVSVKPKTEGRKDQSEQCLLSLGEPVPHPSNIEIPLNKQSFLSRHSLDMKFTYVDQRMTDVLGYTSEDILGKSAFLYYHACDAATLEKCFRTLFSKGQSETGRYRFLAKHGGFVWLLTQATLIYESSSTKPQCVVCVNYVLSGQERPNEVVSLEQVEACGMPLESIQVDKDIREEKEEVDVKELEKATVELEEKEEVKEEVCLPQASTFKIFAPRTADMNKGFLMFDSDSGHTVLEEEPEDLTHLAPQAGDTCFPLDMSTSYPDLLDDAFLSGSLDEEPNVEDENKYSDVVGCRNSLADSDFSLPTAKRLKSPLTNDPFLSLREDEAGTLDYNTDHTHYLLFKSPDKQLSGESRLAKELMGTEGLNLQDDYLSDCAPYIPTNDMENFWSSPASSLLLESALGADSHNLLDIEEMTPLPQSSTKSCLTKLLKGDRTIAQNVSSSRSTVVIGRNDLHSDGSSGCPDEYDSDSLDCETNGVRFSKSPELKTNSNSVYNSCISKLPSKVNLRDSPPEMIDPGNKRFVSTKHESARKTSRVFSLEQHVVTARQKQPFLDETPKRNGGHLSQTLESPKKMKIDPRLVHNTGAQGSVLLNLLVRGEDSSHGYLCPVNQSDRLRYKPFPERSMNKSVNTRPSRMPHAICVDIRSTQQPQKLTL